MASDYIGLEFRAGLWAGDTNFEMFCIGVITKAKELSEITQRIKADESLKTEPWGTPLFSGLGNEEEPKEWKPRERHVLGEGSHQLWLLNHTGQLSSENDLPG